MFANSGKRSAAVLMYACAIFASSAAKADLVTFDVTWGDAEGGSAAATAMITMDTKYITLSQRSDFSRLIPMDELQSLVVTVTGAGDGDGTFGKSDFSSMRFVFGGELTFNGELLGQGFTTATGPFGGQQSDFNFFTSETGTIGGPAAAPNGIGLFEMSTNGNGTIESGPGIPEQHEIIVESIIATTVRVNPVPEPETYALLLSGLGLAGSMARRKRK